MLAMKTTEYSCGEVTLPKAITCAWVFLELTKLIGTELGGDGGGTNITVTVTG